MTSVYDCKNARFDQATIGMTDDELRNKAPSIFTATASPKCSEAYKPIATIDIINFLRTECNIVPVAAIECKAKDSENREYTKHMVRYRHLGDRQYQVGDTCPEIIGTNSANLTSPVAIMAGMFRLRCQNSLVVMDAGLDEFRLKHLGQDFREEVFKGALRIAEQANKALDAVENWSSCQLEPEEKLLIAKHVHKIRFGGKGEAIKPAQFLDLHPVKDGTGNDLWTTINGCQRQAIQGGMHGTAQTSQGRNHGVSTKELTSIDRRIKINRGIWALGTATYNFKSRAAAMLPAPTQLAA